MSRPELVLTVLDYRSGLERVINGYDPDKAAAAGGLAALIDLVLEIDKGARSATPVDGVFDPTPPPDPGGSNP